MFPVRTSDRKIRDLGEVPPPPFEALSFPGLPLRVVVDWLPMAGAEKHLFFSFIVCAFNRGVVPPATISMIEMGAFGRRPQICAQLRLALMMVAISTSRAKAAASSATFLCATAPLAHHSRTGECAVKLGGLDTPFAE
jgi:hypothetical protein